MNKSFTRILFATVGLGLMMQQASALPARLGLGLQDGLPHAGHLVEGRVTAAPAAFSEYCVNYSSECRSGSGGAEMVLDASRWAELQSVNASVNQRITAKSDPSGEDHWTLGVSSGDCDDYAVQKRQDLEGRGWPVGSLSLTAAYLPNGQGHLVLVVRTDRGEFVLDNMRENVVPADRVNYRWVARQSTEHPQMWVRVNGSRHDDVQMVRLRRDEQMATVTPVSARSAPEEVTGGIAKAAAKIDSAAATLQNYLLNR